MTARLHYIFCLVAIGLFGATASAQEQTANRSGMGDLRHFAEHCLDTAPTFLQTAREIRIREQAEDRGNGFRDIGKLALIERDGHCVCATSFIDWHTHVPDVVQNLHYVVKEEARLAWQSAQKDPTKITLDFNGIEAVVTIGYRETQRDGILVVSTMIEREGACPV